MGSSQSSRKLTIVNDEEDVNVIRISDAVAKRLSQTATETSVQPVKREVLTAPHVSAVPAAKAALPPQTLTDGYYPQFTISALEVAQEKEKELVEQELYWQQRLQNLEKTHENINQTIEEEYKKALSFFDDCRVIKVQDVTRPCTENSQKVLQCYQENPKETLRCADLVAEFSNCVDQRRAQIMHCK